MRHTGAHPRSRGEHPLPIRYYPPYQGSSPLARGTPGKISGIIASIGLIPARAGNTGGELFAGGGGGAHPRSRGEHAGRASQTRAQWGSSPLARGTPVCQLCAELVQGLIPARAGNTPRLQAALDAIRAHPRSRGEHNVSGVDKPNGWGSSPLARGTRLGCKVSGGSFGLIPARAGNTARAKGDKSENGAHPRSRGEHSIAPVFDTVRVGSSPLARGTRSQPVPDGITHGLIPARAGNTRSSWPARSCCGAHPRSRGEHGLKKRLGRLAAGSSPLARGTRAVSAGGWFFLGLIPARAGNT